MKNGGHALAPYAALVATMVFWGLSFVATKVALTSIPTFTLVFLRFALAALIFVLLLRGAPWPAFAGRDRMKMVLLALFEPGLYFIFETIGLQHISAPKAALIIATIPIVVLVLSTWLLGERVTRGSVTGILLSFAGIALLVVGDPDFGWHLEGSLLGDLLIGGAVVSASLYMIVARDLGRSYSSRQITFAQIVYGAGFYALLFVWELPTLNVAAITGRSLLAVGYLTLFATVGAFLCYNYALTRVPVSRAAVFVNAIPVITALGAWALLDERLTRLQTGGGILVLVAVTIANLPAAAQAARQRRR